MAYTALYRKFRPMTFSEMVGQDHITTTLKNQIKANRVGHAYLFNGSRGTGKTSAAKILARAVNCLNPQDGEPCNECEICKGILSGSLTDIVEMDAASNNGVDDIRDIREEVNFLPAKAKYRVYIIDEVHMLSSGAFNALLKTLEEPPEHVKFILATTEPQKLPATILSRCQRFDFKRISNDNIKKRLKIVCDESKIEISEGALNTISVLSEGAMRDALSILERCVQNGDNKIDEDKVKDLVGIPKTAYIHDIVNSIIDYNVDDALATVDKVLDDGKDINNLIWEIIKYVKDILVYKASKKVDIYNEEEKTKIDELSKKVEKERLINLVYEFSKLENDLKYSTQKKIIFQAGIIKLCNRLNTSEESSLEERVNKIEKYLKSGTVTVQNNSVKSEPIKQQNYQPVIQKQKEETESKKIDTNKNTKKRMKATNKDITTEWPKIVSKLKQNGKVVLATNLLNSTAKEINDLVVEVNFPNGLNSFAKTILEKTENTREITNLVSMALGKEMNVRFVSNNNSEVINQGSQNIENLANQSDIPFNVIE